jgi:hypothetical protein
MPKLPGMVFVDTQARMTAGANENSSQDMGSFNWNIDRIRELVAGEVVTLHHLNRDGEYRGSSVVPGALDTWLKVTKQNNGTTVRVECRKQKDSEEFETFHLIRHRVSLGQTESGEEIDSLVFLTPSEVQGSGTTSEGTIRLAFPIETDPSESKVLVALRGATEAQPQTRAGVQELTGLGKSRTSTLLSRLVNSGHTRKAGTGSNVGYWLTSLGEQRLEREGVVG